jgi:hypothetical protein
VVDLYCERLGPGLLAEPLNAVTNLAFLAAAVAAWRLLRALGTAEAGDEALVGLMVSVGAGSALFHTFAAPWSRVLDVLPILTFQLLFSWLYLRRMLNATLPLVIVALGVLLIATVTGRLVPRGIEWSLHYLPALVVLTGLGSYHYLARKSQPTLLLAAAFVFMLSLLARTADGPLCGAIPFGTHFLWHLLNASVMYLAFKSLVANRDGFSPVGTAKEPSSARH